MNARTIVAISCLLLVAVSIEVTLKELTEAPSTTQGANGCGCIPLPRAAPQIVFHITSQPTFPKEGVSASDRAWKTDGDIAASSANVEALISSYSTKGSQE